LLFSSVIFKSLSGRQTGGVSRVGLREQKIGIHFVASIEFRVVDVGCVVSPAAFIKRGGCDVNGIAAGAFVGRIWQIASRGRVKRPDALSKHQGALVLISV
jgi:hypothetical protein